MSALFERIAGPLKEAIQLFALPLMTVAADNFYVMSARKEKQPTPDGIFSIWEIKPHTVEDGWEGQPGWTVSLNLTKLGLGLREIELSLGPALDEAVALAIVWDQVSLDNAVGRAATERIYGYARSLTPAEVIEFLVEEDL